MEQKYKDMLMEARTTHASVAELHSLEGLYLIHERKSVFEFIENHPNLIPLLFELYTVVHSFFPDTRISLEIRSDPDEYVADIMTAYIISIFEPDETLRRLEEFDQQWWLNNADRAMDSLVINFAY